MRHVHAGTHLLPELTQDPDAAHELQSTALCMLGLGLRLIGAIVV